MIADDAHPCWRRCGTSVSLNGLYRSARYLGSGGARKSPTIEGSKVFDSTTTPDSLKRDNLRRFLAKGPQVNISRGFSRLSVLVAVLGAAVIFFFAITGGLSTPSEFATAILVLVIVPAGLVLLLGWVVAGFKSPN